MINLIDIEKVCKNLTPVTTSEYVTGKSFSFHPEGLFSELIFGSKEEISNRKSKYSYINLNCMVLHPALSPVIRRYNRKIMAAIKREAAYNINKDGILVEDPNGSINGITSVMANFKNIIESSSDEEPGIRNDIKKMLLQNYKDGKLFISKCLVIPAGWREAVQDTMHGGYQVDPINDFYVRVIRSSNQVQSFKTGPMLEIFSSKMQNLLDELYSYIISKISKKEGLVRQNLLGKRADFTGRAVITGGSTEIRVDEIGIPFKILVKIFEPFILYYIMNSGKIDKSQVAEALLEYNSTTLDIPNLRLLFTGISRGDQLSDKLDSMMKIAVRDVISDKMVLAKRDPALHSESVQGFKPVLVEGDTIQLSIAKCAGFNADFDGDQMAIYVPVTKEAINEARTKMMSSESKDSLNHLTDSFEKDIIVGLYSMTRNPKEGKDPIKVKDEEELRKLEVTHPIRYDGMITTPGKVLFNRLLPAKFKSEDPIDKKKLKNLMLKLYNYYGEEDRKKYVDFCQELSKFGAYYYTVQGHSFSLEDLEIPQNIVNLKEKLKKAQNPDEADAIIKRMESELKDHILKHNINLDNFISAGGLKGMSQIRQILVTKGLVQNLDGSVEIIHPSFSDGMTSSEYFKTGRGARSGIIDRVINTSDTGYLSRKLVYVLQRVEADPGVKDCGTKRFLPIKVTDDVEKRIHGRYIVNQLGFPVLYDREKHFNKVVNLRTPIYCTTNRICSTCYGQLLQRNKTHYVGILAGQILGEYFTQNIMRTFHVGGSVNVKRFDLIKDISKLMDESDRAFFVKNFKQTDSDFISSIEGHILIDMGAYEDFKDDITVKDLSVDMNYGYFKIVSDGREIDVTLDSVVHIDLSNKAVEKDGDILKISYQKDTSLFNLVPTPDIFSEKVKIAEALFSGRSPWKDANHFFAKVNEIYSGLGCDLVHVEVLVSNLLRDKGNPSYPARRNKNFNPTMISLKKIPAKESWLQSFMFENPNESILTGLLYDRPETETILERIVTGNL